MSFLVVHFSCVQTFKSKFKFRHELQGTITDHCRSSGLDCWFAGTIGGKDEGAWRGKRQSSGLQTAGLLPCMLQLNNSSCNSIFRSKCWKQRSTASRLLNANVILSQSDDRTPMNCRKAKVAAAGSKKVPRKQKKKSSKSKTSKADAFKLEQKRASKTSTAGTKKIRNGCTQDILNG